MDWGQKGSNGNDTRPGYFNNVHGIAVDPVSRHVFVNDRGNHRIQVFDENGKFLYQWKIADAPSDIHLIYIGADRNLWAFDRGTSKMLKYDLQGHFLYSWGTWGDFPGGFWGVHGFSVDQDGNFYVAEVDNGRVQKFTPRPGANPAYMVGKPVYAAWNCPVVNGPRASTRGPDGRNHRALLSFPLRGSGEERPMSERQSGSGTSDSGASPAGSQAAGGRAAAKLPEDRIRHEAQIVPAERLGDTTTSHGPLGQGASDVPSAAQNLSGLGKSQAPAVGVDNATSAASPSGPKPLAEQRENEAIENAPEPRSH
jgi:hypothetical protein